METKDWIAIAAALIVAIGWFVTGWLNRVKDVQQKRLSTHFYQSGTSSTAIQHRSLIPTFFQD